MKFTTQNGTTFYIDNYENDNNTRTYNAYGRKKVESEAQ